MKIYLVFTSSKWVRDEKKPLKAFLNKAYAERVVKEGQDIFYKFERYRIQCDRLESLNYKIWDNNRPIKTKANKYWNYDQNEFRDIFYEEVKSKLSEKELRYHYQHCKDNNLVHIPCYDSYEIVEMDVE